MKKYKNQKGAISLFTTYAMIFFLTFMVGAFTLISRRSANQSETIQETKQIYQGVETANDTYNNIMSKISDGATNYSLSLVEQLEIAYKMDEANSIIMDGYEYTKEDLENWFTDTEPIILEYDEEIIDKLDITIYDYMLYNDESNESRLSDFDIYYKLIDNNGEPTFWKCVFYQYIGTDKDNMNKFESKDEIEAVYTNKKYSILGNIDSYKYDDKYEFLLTYALREKNGTELTFREGMYQRWKQTNNPLDEDEVDLVVEGYEEVYLGLGTSNYWGGLVTSNNGTRTWIDGSVGNDTWYFSVGTKSWWGSTSYVHGIPVTEGAMVTNLYDASSNQCLLFVRVKMEEENI